MLAVISPIALYTMNRRTYHKDVVVYFQRLEVTWARILHSTFHFISLVEPEEPACQADRVWWNNVLVPQGYLKMSGVLRLEVSPTSILSSVGIAIDFIVIFLATQYCKHAYYSSIAIPQGRFSHKVNEAMPQGRRKSCREIFFITYSCNVSAETCQVPIRAILTIVGVDSAICPIHQYLRNCHIAESSQPCRRRSYELFGCVSNQITLRVLRIEKRSRTRLSRALMHCPIYIA